MASAASRYCSLPLIHARTGPVRPASGAFDPGSRRSHPQEPRHSRSTSAAPASATRCRKPWSNHAGAVVFGGPNSANDEEDFIRREIDWLKVPLREEKPYLGICLGAQILARHLGSAVYCHRDGQVEIGYYPLRPTRAGREVCEALAGPRLPVASRGLRPAARRTAAGRRRRVPDPDVPLGTVRLRGPVPPRSHPRHDVPLDHARRRADGASRGPSAPGPFRGSRSPRLCHPDLARGFSRPLDRANPADASGGRIGSRPSSGPIGPYPSHPGAIGARPAKGVAGPQPFGLAGVAPGTPHTGHEFGREPWPPNCVPPLGGGLWTLGTRG